MNLTTVPLHAGHPGLLFEVAGGVAAGAVVGVTLFVLIRRIARGSGTSGTVDPGRTR